MGWIMGKSVVGAQGACEFTSLNIFLQNKKIECFWRLS